MKEKRFTIDITNKKYRNTLLISYGFIAAIAIGIMITFLFGWFNSYTKKIIAEMAATQLYNLDNIMQNNLETYRTQLRNAYQEPNIRGYLFTNSNSFEEGYQIGRYLQNMVVNNGVADYVALYKKETGFSYYGWRYPGEDEITQIEEKLPKTTNDMQYFIVDTGKRRQLCLFLTDRPYLNGAPERGVIYALNLDKLKEQLVSSKTSDQVFLCFSGSGEILLEGELAKEDMNLIWSLLSGEGTGESGKELALQSSHYLCSSKINEKNGMIMVMLQDFQVTRERMSEIRKAIYLPALISILLVLLFAFFMANKIYYPLERFFKGLKSSAVLLPPDDTYSKRQIEITSEKILGQISVMSQHYHSDKVLSYLEGNVDAGDAVPTALQLNDRNEQCFMLMCFTESEQPGDGIVQAAVRKMESLFEGCKITAFSDARSPWFLLLFKEFRWVGRFEELNQLAEVIREGLACVGKENNAVMYSAVSGLIRQEENLRPQFKLLLGCVKYHLLGRCEAVMDETYLSRKCQEDIPTRLGEDILAMVRQGKGQEACAGLPPLFNLLGEYEIQKAMLFLAQLCTQLRQCISGTEWSGKLKQENSLEYYIKLTALFDRGQVERYIEQLIGDTCLENKVFQEKTLRINMLMAVEYIQEHYRDSDLSVEQVAERFHISVSYFSKLFNEYVGMTFPEFINDLRLTCAKEMLKANPTITVKKVTEICGFSSVSYFSNQFKKKFGCSPSTAKIGR